MHQFTVAKTAIHESDFTELELKSCSADMASRAFTYYRILDAEN